MNRQESIYLPQFTIGEDAFDAFSVEMGRYGNKVVIGIGSLMTVKNLPSHGKSCLLKSWKNVFL